MTTETTSEEAFLLLDEARPTFAEPWEAQVFSLVVELNRRGLVTWSDWASRLAFEISNAKDRGDPDRGDTYYGHWLATLEQILLERSLMSEPEMADRVDQWRRAYLNTPHGKPIELAAGLS